jgi:hypothetical protein
METRPSQLRLEEQKEAKIETDHQVARAARDPATYVSELIPPGTAEEITERILEQSESSGSGDRGNPGFDDFKHWDSGYDEEEGVFTDQRGGWRDQIPLVSSNYTMGDAAEYVKRELISSDEVEEYRRTSDEPTLFKYKEEQQG